MALKRYRVAAEDTKVLDYATGDEFEFDFSEEAGYDEAALLASGAVVEVTGDEPKEKPKELTKEELLDITRERGISSDDKMTKKELEEAIAAHEAAQ